MSLVKCVEEESENGHEGEACAACAACSPCFYAAWLPKPVAGVWPKTPPAERCTTP